MTTTPQLQLSPSSFTVKIDGVTIESKTWDKALSLLSQQAAIRRQPVTFGVYDAEPEPQAVFTIDAPGQLTRQEAGAQERAALLLSDWAISRIDGPTLITFTSATAAMNHIQLVADIAKAPIPVLLTGYYLHNEEKNFIPDGAGAGSQATLSQEELESNLLSADLSQPATGAVPQVEAPSPAVEPADAGTTVPAGTEELAPHPVDPTPAPEVERTYLFEEPEQTKASKLPFWQRLSAAAGTIETPAFLAPTRNKVIAGAGIAALLLSIGGISAAIIANSDNTETAGISQTVLSVPAGYSEQPLWSLALPEDTYVKATNVATALITVQTLSLYDSATGDKIRDIPLDAPISTLGEATIGEAKALIWRTGNTLHAWTAAAGAEGELITAELPANSTLSGTGQAVLVLNPDSAAVLTSEGLTPYEVPADYTAMAATSNGIIAGNFTPTVLTIDPQGQAIGQVNLAAPHEGQSLHSWKHADATISVTIWAQNPDAVCETSDTSGCKEEVTVAVHTLADGQVTASYDMTLEDVAALGWVDGEGDKYGALGSYVFDEATGQQVTVLPDGLTVEKIKGRFSMTTAKDGAGLIFHSNNDGYQLSSVLLAETDNAAIVQQGDRVVAYPLAVQ